MTPYEAAMKRLELENDMAWELKSMWLYAESGEFVAAMECQLFYLMARDELVSGLTTKSSLLYYDMEYIAEYGSIK